MKRERKGEREREAKQCRQIRFSFRAVDEGIIREQSNKKTIYIRIWLCICADDLCDVINNKNVALVLPDAVGFYLKLRI